MRAGVVWAWFVGGLLCLSGGRAIGAPDETEAAAAPPAHPVVAPGSHSLAPITKKVKPAARSLAETTESADDPESRPLTHYRKPGSVSGSEEDSGSLAMNVAGKLALVVALILGCAAAWKRYQGGMPQIGQAQSHPVKVSSTVPLGPQRYLHVVTVGRRQLLLASCPQSISLIGTLDSQSELIDAQAPHSAQRQSVHEEEECLTGFEDEADLAGSSTDRFEELLLRLRDLESGPANHAPPAGPRTARDQPAARPVRTPDPGAHSIAERRNLSRTNEGPRIPDLAERRTVVDDAGDARGWAAREMAGTLAPGSLFRSPARAPREVGDA